MDEDTNYGATPQCLVLVFPDIDTVSDGLLALHALRGGEYPVSAVVEGNIRVPELSTVEILDMEIYREREDAGEPLYQIPPRKIRHTPAFFLREHPNWERGEEASEEVERRARDVYQEENMEQVTLGIQSGFVAWPDTVRGVRDSYRMRAARMIRGMG